MKHLLILALILTFLPFVLLALWYVLKTPGMLDAEKDYPVLDNPPAKGAIP